MFEYLHGTVADKSPGLCVLDVNGVGYLVEIPVSTFTQLPAEGKATKLLIHYLVREDAQKLYGFNSESEREAFRSLIGISKIGPKVALAILSNLSIKDLAYAVAAADATRLKAVPGVGLKTAQRLAVELKGKLNVVIDEAVDTKGGPATSEESAQAEVEREAYSAMISLGYTESQVIKALARVRETVENEIPVEEWIRKALQVI